MKYQEIYGDLIKLAKEGKFDVISHGCNCHCVMGAGIAPLMAKAFNCDKLPKENKFYKSDINKLGTIDYGIFILEGELLDLLDSPLIPSYDFKQELNFSELQKNHKFVTVINSYTQYNFGSKQDIPLDYEALTLCMRKINREFKGLHIGLPYVIGCGLAGGDKGTVIAIIKEELRDMQVTMVKYDKK